MFYFRAVATNAPEQIQAFSRTYAPCLTIAVLPTKHGPMKCVEGSIKAPLWIITGPFSSSKVVVSGKSAIVRKLIALGFNFDICCFSE